MNNKIINFHHNTPVKRSRYFCDLYAFGKCTSLTNEEYVEWLVLQYKSKRKQKQFINKITKLRESEKVNEQINRKECWGGMLSL